jgi:hypothetical protein
LFDGSRELSEIIEDVARLGARLIIQTAVEAEVDVFLGGIHQVVLGECALFTGTVRLVNGRSVLPCP